MLTHSHTPASLRRELPARARRVVIKLGTAVLVNPDGGAARDRIGAFARAIAALIRDGREVLLVTSGACGLGAERLGITPARNDAHLRRACAAVGQSALIALYDEAFGGCGQPIAQLLVTDADFADGDRADALRGTLEALLAQGLLPIINENDAVAIGAAVPAGRQPAFTDNDQLAALVAVQLDADLLVILTDVDGLHTADPRGPGVARLIPVVAAITRRTESIAGGARRGRGGMRTKLAAARIATAGGSATIIANGMLPGVIENVLAGDELGTLFLPRAEPLRAAAG